MDSDDQLHAKAITHLNKDRPSTPYKPQATLKHGLNKSLNSISILPIGNCCGLNDMILQCGRGDAPGSVQGSFEGVLSNELRPALRSCFYPKAQKSFLVG